MVMPLGKLIILLIGDVVAATSCSTQGRVDAHRLSPPRFCNAFKESSSCVKHFTPRGLCTWDLRSGECVTSAACNQRIATPTGRSYMFFKFHKVGSSTVGGTLRLALIATTGNVFASCLRVSKLRNKTEVERARYKFCSLCSKHDNTLPLLSFFRQPEILQTNPRHRLSAMFHIQGAAAVLDRACPQRASMGNVLRTGTVFRRPVDRLISKYYFLRTYCASKAARLGKASCAALDLELLPWLYHSPGRGEAVGVADWSALYEVLAYLGDHNYTEASLRRAQATIDAIDVVGITERMDETMVLYSEVWQLPLAVVRQSYVSLLVNPSKKPVNASVREAIEAHPAVARETQLYEYALAKFERQIAAIPDRAAKVASIAAAAYVCSLAKNCTAGSLAQQHGAADDDDE